ncbi:MAG: hypothetical protein IMZ61_05760 [Planctomycetes bacterium]|nr:hypothetical protein [Planctomycetota bacterium]
MSDLLIAAVVRDFYTACWPRWMGVGGFEPHPTTDSCWTLLTPPFSSPPTPYHPGAGRGR